MLSSNKKFLLAVNNLVTAYIQDKIDDDEFSELWLLMGLKMQEAKREYNEKYKALGVDIYKLWTKQEL